MASVLSLHNPPPPWLSPRTRTLAFWPPALPLHAAAKFDFNDFLRQWKVVSGMGSVSSVVKMLPGMNKIADKQLQARFRVPRLSESRACTRAGLGQYGAGCWLLLAPAGPCWPLLHRPSSPSSCCTEGRGEVGQGR